MGEATFSPRPVLTKGQLTQLVLAKGCNEKLTLIGLICWTFLRRASSECLPLTAQMAEEALVPDNRLGGERL